VAGESLRKNADKELDRKSPEAKQKVRIEEKKKGKSQ